MSMFTATLGSDEEDKTFSNQFELCKLEMSPELNEKVLCPTCTSCGKEVVNVPVATANSVDINANGTINLAFENDTEGVSGPRTVQEDEAALTEVVVPSKFPRTSSNPPPPILANSLSSAARRRKSVQITEPPRAVAPSLLAISDTDEPMSKEVVTPPSGVTDTESEAPSELSEKRTSFDMPGDWAPPPRQFPRKQSFAHRASVSMGGLRRKSVEVALHTVSAYRGIILAMISSVFFTLTAAIVKYLKDVHPGQTASFRFLGILLFTIPLVLQAGVNPLGPRDKRIFLLLRGIAGASSLYLRYSALHYLPIANATIIVLSMPVFVCIFARVFLKEACGIFHVVAIGVTLLGIGVTSKINVLVGLSESSGVDKTNEMWGLIYSMCATLIGSSAYILVRKVKEVHHSVILFNFAVVATVETSIITVALDGYKFTECGYAPWFLIVLAVFSFYAQLLLTKALQVEEASLVSVTRSSMEVVCAFIFQIVFFHQIPEWTAFVGAALVSSSVLLTTARKWVFTLPEGHWGKRYLWFTTK